MNVVERRRIEQRVRDAYDAVAADTDAGAPYVTFITTRADDFPSRIASSSGSWSGRLSFLVGVSAVALAAVLVLLATVVDRQEPAARPTDVPTVPEFYRRLASALERPGQVYRQDESLSSGLSGAYRRGTFRRTTWIDPSAGGGRLEQTAPQQPDFRYGELVDGAQGYTIVRVIANGVPTGQVDSPNTGTVPACYGTTPALSLVLDCSTMDPELHAQLTVTSDDYRGTRAIVLETTTRPDPKAGGTVPSVSRLYVDADTYLPIATVTTYEGTVAIRTSDGTATQTEETTNRSTYDPGFVDRTELAPDFFTVTSLTEWASVPNSEIAQATPSAEADPTACIGATPPNYPIAGCILERDMQLNPDQRAALEANQPLAGVPVYDEGTKTTVIGYMTDVGFVPNDLVSRYDDLKTCNEKVSAALSAGTSTIPDASCRDLLTQQGVSPDMLDRVHRPN